jgi:dTDP-4-dehydrorhamnose reductase
MLGTDVSNAFAAHDVLALSRAELDITKPEECRAALLGADVVVNAAGYTRVDDAETEEPLATLINAHGARNLAAAAREAGARMVQISTDYVFDGSAELPYAEDQTRNPISAYGRSKALGEELVLAEHPTGAYVVRTAWLYGKNGGNFAATMLRLAASHPTVSVVTDQKGQPTWTRDLAEQILRLAESDAPAGVYHGTNAGETTWFGFTKAIYEECGLDPERVTPTTSANFQRPAPRPAYSVLGHDAWARAGIAPMRPWREALSAAVRDGALTAP